MSKINAFIKNRVALELLVSLFAIAGAILYVQRPHFLPLAFRAALWLLIICTVLVAALKFWRALAERKSTRRLPEIEPRVAVDWWCSIAGIAAVVITGSILRNLTVAFFLVVLFVVFDLLAKTSLRNGKVSFSAVVNSLLWAGVLAFFIVYLRTANGFITPIEPSIKSFNNIPAAYLSEGFAFDKSHIRTSLFQFIGFFFSTILLALPLFKFKTEYKWSWISHPTFPLAVFFTLTGVLNVPPFNLDPAHWTHWLGPSAALSDGLWPYLDTFSYYGFLPILILSSWTSIFGISPLSLSSLLSILAFASTLFIYILIAKRSHSNYAALLGVIILIFLAYDNNQSLGTPNHSALRFHLYVAISLWAGYKLIDAFQSGRMSTYGYSFLLGVMTTWSPSDGLFLLIATSSSLGIFAISGRPNALKNSAKGYLAYALGVISVLIIVLIFRGNLTGTKRAFDEISDFFSIFTQGYGYHGQYFDATWVLFLISSTIVISYCIRAILLGKICQKRVIFCIYSSILVLPVLLQSIGRSPVNPNGILWIALPCLLIVAAKPFERLSRSSPSTTIIMSLLAASVLITIGNPLAKFTSLLSSITVGREGGINNWSNQCLKNQLISEGCSPVDNVTLNGLYKKETAFSFESDKRFMRMISECQAGAIIVDDMDSFVYEIGKCRPKFYYQSIFSVSSKNQVDNYLREITGHNYVFFGTSTRWQFQNKLIEQIKDSWLLARNGPSDCDSTKIANKEFALSALSDNNFSRGIGLNNFELLLDTDRGMICHLSAGTRLRFSSGIERVVLGVKGNSVLLSSGPKLNPFVDGFPNKITIIGKLITTNNQSLSFLQNHEFGCSDCFPKIVPSLNKLLGPTSFGSFDSAGDAAMGYFYIPLSTKGDIKRVRYTIGPGNKNQLGIRLIKQCRNNLIEVQNININEATPHQENGFYVNIDCQPKKMVLEFSDTGEGWGQWIGFLGVEVN